MSALLDRLDGEGLLVPPAILVTGDFGRTPKVKGNSGRDERAMCSSMAGGSVEGGQTIGVSDGKAQGPIDRNFTPDDLAATFFKYFGIDPKTEYQANFGRPMTLIRDGQPIPGLLS